MRLRFLGTGASGGTPGRGRSRRQESSLVVDAGVRIVIDVTRDFERQSALEDLDAVLLTHAHADACGGVAQLRRWLRARDMERLPLYASAATIAALEKRFRRLDHCDFNPVRPGQRRRRLFSHLTIDRELARLCDWEVERIVLTQIGRTAPPHERLERAVRRLCARARPAYDGLVLELH